MEVFTNNRNSRKYQIGYALSGGFIKAKNLEDLQLPLIITATDLDHGRMVHFHRGSIAERVAASCCMPVMFAPVNIDGTNYVDGGLMMNLPVSTLRRVCNKVVAVNVSPIMAQDYNEVLNQLLEEKGKIWK